MSLSIRKEAEADITEAYEYYESCQQNLGTDFISCIEESFEHIKNNPNEYRKIYKNVRRALVRRFPFGVYYIVFEDSVSVIGVHMAGAIPKQSLLAPTSLLDDLAPPTLTDQFYQTNLHWQEDRVAHSNGHREGEL